MAVLSFALISDAKVKIQQKETPGQGRVSYFEEMVPMEIGFWDSI